MGFEGGAESGQAQVAVDAAELVTGFEHPGGALAQCHGPVAAALDVLGVLPASSAKAGTSSLLRALFAVSSASSLAHRAGEVEM